MFSKLFCFPSIRAGQTMDNSLRWPWKLAQQQFLVGWCVSVVEEEEGAMP